MFLKNLIDKWDYLALDLINIKDDLNNQTEIYNFMSSIAMILDEEELYKPVLIPYYHGRNKNDCGISCYSFFNNWGGYATFHIFEKRKIAYFDIVSSKKIKREVVEKVKEFCQTKACNIYLKDQRGSQETGNIFGPHFFAIGKADKKLTTDDLLDFQTKIINGIKMNPIINPVVVNTKKSKTIFVAIAESHIALTQKGNGLMIDVFSCKNFDLNKLKKVVGKYMNIKEELLFQRHFKEL